MANPYYFYALDGRKAVIRPALPRDARGLVFTINSVCREEIFLLNEYCPKTEREQERIILSLDYSKNLIAVAELEGIIVGGMALLIGGFSPKSQHFCTLGIHLVGEARGLGIGSEMLNYAIYCSKQMKYRKICLSVFSSNTRAIHLYKKFGFEEEGRRREQYRIGRTYVDEVLMSKFLAMD